MSVNTNNIAWKILVPVIIGLSVVAWLFHREFSAEVWESIHFDSRVLWCIALAWLFMIGREYGMCWRFRVITDRFLSWTQCVKVTMLCEFTSCITPTSVGGSALGMVFMNREGIELGRSTSLMMTTIFLDELFFVISLPVIMALVPYKDLFGFSGNTFTVGLETVFWIIYAGIFLWTLLLFLGILVRPRAVRTGLNRIFRLKWLIRWSAKADELGHNMETTGMDIRHRPARWWAEAFGATALSWCSRYMVVNALFLGLVPAADQLVVFARQFVVWVILMVSPTPGGAGISEWLFTTYYGDLIGSAGMALIIALFWRIISYYVYLVIGACIVPSWIMKLKK